MWNSLYCSRINKTHNLVYIFVYYIIAMFSIFIQGTYYYIFSKKFENDKYFVLNQYKLFFFVCIGNIMMLWHLKTWNIIFFSSSYERCKEAHKRSWIVCFINMDMSVVPTSYIVSCHAWLKTCDTYAQDKCLHNNFKTP